LPPHAWVNRPLGADRRLPDMEAGCEHREGAAPRSGLPECLQRCLVAEKLEEL
jgi:hypothetical protein